MDKVRTRCFGVFLLMCMQLTVHSLVGQEYMPTGEPQKRITIEECQQWAMENYPAIQMHQLLEKAEKYTLSNIARTYRPEFSLSGGASWQSERMELDLKMPENMDVTLDLNGPVSIPITIPETSIPISDRDRYNVALTLQQAIWAGGRVKAGKEMAKSEIDMRHAELDARLYEIKDKVKQLYFGLLTIKGKAKQLDRAFEILDSLQSRAEIALKEGVIYESDLDVIEVERIKYEQLERELEAKWESCLDVLSMLTNRQLSKGTEVVLPVLPEITSDEIKRPELAYMEQKIKRLDADLKMVNAENMPKVGLFATGGYGKSGLNTFDRDFKPYFVGGVMLSWNFGKLNTSKNNKRLKQVQQESVRTEQESFIFNTRMEALMQDAEIKKLKDMLKSDERIADLREDIRRASEVKYANGVYTISELIADVNQAFIARQEMALREIELNMLIYSKKITLGL